MCGINNIINYCDIVVRSDPPFTESILNSWSNYNVRYKSVLLLLRNPPFCVYQISLIYPTDRKNNNYYTHRLYKVNISKNNTIFYKRYWG